MSFSFPIRTINNTLTGIAVFTVVSACAGTSLEVSTRISAAIAVWNQAYQEHYKADSIADITENARNAYVLLDPFSEDVASSVPAIKANGNQVAAYISIGTGENWRADFAALQPYLVDKEWGDWAGEYFISTPNDAVVAIMKARIDKIADWGFDWVEFDNMDWVYDQQYRAEYGFEASIADGAAYYQTLCDYVQERDMQCMAKSTGDGTTTFGGATYESYPDDKNWWDQESAASFLAQGKLVIIVHYDETDCAGVYDEYRAIYGDGLSFICEDRRVRGYVHFNE